MQEYLQKSRRSISKVRIRRLEEYAISQGWEYEVISEIASAVE